MSDQDAIALKLAAARTRLILDKPFLGALVLRLPLTVASSDWCKTTATDARKFYYNAEYIDSLSMEQTQFMLAHEALHCALSHFARRQHRVKHRWDLACDFAINPLLVDEGLKPPPNAHVMETYKGMTAEEIYPLIEDNEDMDTLDQHVYDKDNESGEGNEGKQRESELKNQQQPRQEKDNDRDSGAQQQPSGENNSNADQQAGNGASQPPPLDHAERETLEVQWQQRMAGAAQQALQAGKMGDSIARMVDHLLQPRLPWRMLLARYMTQVARDDFSYMRPSRREGDAVLPSLRSSQVEIVVAVDTSGSIQSKEIDEFLSEISAIKGQMRARISLFPCDAAIAEDAPFIYEPWEEFEMPENLSGGGGTDFRPVFDWLRNNGTEPALLVYFTDAEGQFPELEAGFPVIWLVKGKAPTPWGQRIQLN